MKASRSSLTPSHPADTVFLNSTFVSQIPVSLLTGIQNVLTFTDPTEFEPCGQATKTELSMSFA